MHSHLIDLDYSDVRLLLLSSFFFFNATATTEIYTLSLHDALPIFIHPTNPQIVYVAALGHLWAPNAERGLFKTDEDRKSTRLNSSHLGISYAVFCLKKKKKTNTKNNRLTNTK